MQANSISRPADLVQIGAGLIGRHLAPLLAALPNVKRVRLIDRDSFENDQLPEHAGRPKAVVVAHLMRARNPKLEVEPIVGDIDDLPLGLLHGDVLLTCLDSRRARVRANFAFAKLGIPYWLDAGISAPWLARITIFAKAKDAPCYECGLSPADYAAEQIYTCQPAHSPPRTNSPEHLGTFAAALQACELAKILTGAQPPALLNHEYVYDLAGHKLAETRLVRQPGCRFDHQRWSIQRLKGSAQCVTLQDALGLEAPHRTAPPQLQVPGMLIVRRLVCSGCGEQRPVLRLKGRLSKVQQTCTQCGQRMSPLGISLTNALTAADLAPRERSKPLTVLGLCDTDVFAVSRGDRTAYFTFHR